MTIHDDLHRVGQGLPCDNNDAHEALSRVSWAVHELLADLKASLPYLRYYAEETGTKNSQDRYTTALKLHTKYTQDG